MKTLSGALKGIQGRFLRAIMGAYRATATEALEIEALVEPLDLYIEKTASTGIVRQILGGYNGKIKLLSQNLAFKTRGRRGRRRNTPPLNYEKTLADLKEQRNIDIPRLISLYRENKDFWKPYKRLREEQYYAK